MKVQPTVFKGIAFVRIAELPKAQQEFIMNSPLRDSLIKIMLNKTLMVDCLQYSIYERWFESEYRKPREQPEPQAPSVLKSMFGLAFE